MPTVKPPKTQTLHRDGYKLVFWLEGKGRDAVLQCNAFKKKEGALQVSEAIQYEESPCLEWTFGKIPGNNLMGNAAIYVDQALMYAKNPPTYRG